jgi:hypothetical protein
LFAPSQTVPTELPTQTVWGNRATIASTISKFFLEPNKHKIIPNPSAVKLPQKITTPTQQGGTTARPPCS